MRTERERQRKEGRGEGESERQRERERKTNEILMTFSWLVGSYIIHGEAHSSRFDGFYDVV